MAWARDAKRLADEGYLVIVFLDELTTVPPTTQAAMLRLLTENVCGELQLPDYEPGKGGVVYLCASNAVEWAAGGQEIQPPMANRLWHGEFPMDHDTWCEMMVSDFPAPANLPVLPADYLRAHHHRQRALIAAYIKAAGRDAWLAPPDDSARRSGAWPSGRTWYMASRLLAAIEAVFPGNRLLQSAALAGLVGDQALPFLEYRETLNLPDPEDILKDPRSLVLPDRTDRAYAVCYFAGRRGAEQQDARALAGGDDRARGCVPEERGHPDGGRAHALRQAQSPGRIDQAARRVPAVLRADAARQASSPRLRAWISAQPPDRADSWPRSRGVGYSRALQAARVRASYQRAYFAPALFSLIPVKTDLIASMAVDTRWRLYYNEAWVAAHSVEENAAVLIHEVSHLLREHDARKEAAAVTDAALWNTAADCEINDDLIAEGLPLPDNPPLPGTFGLQPGENAETYYRQLMKPAQSGERRTGRLKAAASHERDCGSGAHGERRPWELPDDDGSPGGAPGVDP